MKLDKRSKIFLIIFFSIILIPVIIIGNTNYTKEQKLKNRIENRKATRTLTFNNISTAIILDELFKLELSKSKACLMAGLFISNQQNYLFYLFIQKSKCCYLGVVVESTCFMW